MNLKFVYGSLSARFRRIVAAILAGIVILTLLISLNTAKTVYIITDGEIITTVETYTSNINDAIAKAGIELSPSDLISANEEGNISEVYITRSQTVSVKCDGAAITTLAYNETVGELLSRLNLQIGPYDLVSIDVDRSIDHGMMIEITRRTVTYEVETESIPYTTRREASASLPYGTEAVAQEGVNGALSYTYKVTQTEGQEAERVLVSQEITTQAIDEVIQYGTKISQPALSALSVSSDVISTREDYSGGGGKLTTTSGQELSFSRVLTCTATAYTSYGTRTATGTMPDVGTVAVDPSVIPLGSRLYIVSSDGTIVYGIATAEDTGSSIKGNCVDLYFGSESTCRNFGRRSCTVYVLN